MRMVVNGAGRSIFSGDTTGCDTCICLSLSPKCLEVPVPRNQPFPGRWLLPQYVSVPEGEEGEDEGKEEEGEDEIGRGRGGGGGGAFFCTKQGSNVGCKKTIIPILYQVSRSSSLGTLNPRP